MKEDIIKFSKMGFTRKEMAEKLGTNVYKIKRLIKKYGIRLLKNKFNFIGKCKICKNEVKYRYYEEKIVYCSRKCANKREHSQETRDKIKNTLTNTLSIKYEKPKRNCPWCKIDITNKRKKNKFCSRRCAGLHYSNSEKGKLQISEMNIKSVQVQNRRSKNEILFFEMCYEKFKNVENNSPIFNGWDADVIIHDHKLAILWNGKWHYVKLRKGHSVKQVQNRDRIKISEIIKYGYTPYVIIDMGKFSEKKVKEEFSNLLEFIDKNNI